MGGRQGQVVLEPAHQVDDGGEGLGKMVAMTNVASVAGPPLRIWKHARQSVLMGCKERGRQVD